MINELFYKMAGTESQLLSHSKSRKLCCFAHVMRLTQDNTEGSVTTGLVEGVRRHKRPRIPWIDNITAWIGLSGANLF